jgi:activator of HSP90 ATPase
MWYHDSTSLLIQFDLDIFSETSSKGKLRPLVRSKLEPQVREALFKFSTDLIATHGKDVYNPSLNSTPAGSVTGTPAISKPSTPAPTNAPKPKAVTTTSLSEDVEFTTTAKELYDVFVQPEKLAAWTRSKPLIEPKVGGKLVLFQGNVKGEFLALEEGKKIEQTWRLPQWPEGRIQSTGLTTGHYCILKMVFDQGMESTTLRVAWSGVPTGEEDITRRNFREYYVNNIKYVPLV